MPENERQKMIERSNRSSLEIGKYDATEKENQELISILKSYGIRVWRPEVLSRERIVLNLGEDAIRYCGVSFQYSRDPLLVVGDNVIELSMGSLCRIADILAYRKLFLERVFGSNARWFSMPKPDYSLMFEGGSYTKDRFPVLEGGDIHVLGKKVLIGNSLNPTVGSNELGYLWLSSILKPQGYSVERVPIGDEFLHLDAVLSVVRPGLAIITRMVDLSDVPHILL